MKPWKKIEETKKRTSDIHGLKKRNEEKIQKVSHQNKPLICIDYRKSSTFNWIMNKRDICLKIITLFPNNDMRKRRKYRMPSYFKRRRKLNRQK